MKSLALLEKQQKRFLENKKVMLQCQKSWWWAKEPYKTTREQISKPNKKKKIKKTFKYKLVKEEAMITMSETKS